ncbi:MAG TPA: FtsX-like permease family protein, partial [Candidatus Nitrosotenuis sp.]|nr:FtsX-like permease family protein [Candidatus Nitrosotenuis sp.]
VFLTLSGLILAVTLWQLISRQRRQMGILLALGLFPWQIFLHYLTVSVLVGGAGALAGVLVGHLLGQICTRFYADALGLPLVDTPPAWQAMLVALGGALVVSLGAGWWASQRLLGLHPAQALRPEVSSTSRRAPVRLGRRLPLWLRLPLRNLLRQPGRSTVAMLGVASAVAQILMTLAFLDSQEFALRFFFQQVFAYDLRVGLVTQMSPSSLPPVQDWPGVRYSEAYLRQEVILQRGSRRVRTAVWGVPPQARLLRLHDPQRRPLPPPQGDLLLLGTVLMRQLGARPGDTVQMTLDRGPRSRAPTWTYRVGPELFEPVADVAKVGLHQLQRQLLATNPAPPDAVDFLLLDVEPGYHDSVKRRLEREPLVASISDMNDMRSDILDLLRMLDAYKGLMFLFSSILAVAAVTGTTTMSVMERTPELATMSTLGVHRRTLLLMLVTETTMLWLGGFCLGAPAGVALGNWLVNNYQSELLQIQLLVSPSTLLGTAAVSLALCLLAVVNGLRTVLRVPLTEAMSPRE